MTFSPIESTVILYQNGKGIGTGFLVHESGLLATCYHVVRDVFGDNVAAAVGQPIEFETLQSHGIPTSRSTAVLTDRFDAANDVALLQNQGALPTNLHPMTLIRSDTEHIQNVTFKLLGHAELPDKQANYAHYSAIGQIIGVIPRNGVNVLQLKSNDLHRGMSGGAIYVESLGGTVGMQSVRLSVNPNETTWGHNTGFACVSEAIACLSPEQIKLQPPTAQVPAADSQNIGNSLFQIGNATAKTQHIGNINNQTFMVGDLDLRRSGRDLWR